MEEVKAELKELLIELEEILTREQIGEILELISAGEGKRAAGLVNSYAIVNDIKTKNLKVNTVIGAKEILEEDPQNNELAEILNNHIKANLN